MQISKLKMPANIKQKVFDIFYQTMADLKNKNEAESFLNDFLTDVEKVSLAKRLMIAFYLEQGKSYDFIKSNLKVSSATISSVDKKMVKNSQTYSEVLKKIEADQWADKTAKKVTKLVDSIIGK